MPRNLDRRVEVLMPVESTRARTELNAVLDSVFADNVFAWELAADGTWSRCAPDKRGKRHAHQAAMHRRAKARTKRARDVQRRS